MAILNSNRRPRFGFLAALLAIAVCFPPPSVQADVFASVSEIEIPVPLGAQEPTLYPLLDGRLAMSWTEPASKGFAVMTSIGDSAGWSTPQPVVTSEELFVNWADYPSVVAFPDGTLAAHWLEENGASSYSYDVNIALSGDDGKTWGRKLTPYQDKSVGQHGFVTLLPITEDELIAIWLDARAYDDNAEDEDAFTNAMQLRSAVINKDGSVRTDVVLDVRTCTCCQTDAAITNDGSVLVVYRDRTAEEIRDISIVRLVGAVWSKPISVHADGWEIEGCPVNGPAIDARGEKAAVAWFSVANGISTVKVAFSNDAGASFSDAIRLDLGAAAGRVDVLQLDDGSALVSWVEQESKGEWLLVCRVSPHGACKERQTITLNQSSGSMNFPKMAMGHDGVYFVWTQPLDNATAKLGRNVTVRMVRALF